MEISILQGLLEVVAGWPGFVPAAEHNITLFQSTGPSFFIKLMFTEGHMKNTPLAPLPLPDAEDEGCFGALRVSSVTSMASKDCGISGNPSLSPKTWLRAPSSHGSLTGMDGGVLRQASTITSVKRRRCLSVCALLALQCHILLQALQLRQNHHHRPVKGLQADQTSIDHLSLTLHCLCLTRSRVAMGEKNDEPAISTSRLPYLRRALLCAVVGG